MTNTAFLFPGQGSQYVGMGKRLHDQFTAAKLLFEEANDTLGYDLVKLCFEGSHQELMQTMNTQPAILAVSVIAFEIGRQELGWEPRFMAGHSLGEYSALVCSGVMSYRDGLSIVRKRGMLMQAAVSSSLGAMAAVTHVTADQLDEWCRRTTTETSQVVIACYNSLRQHVIAGHQEAVRAVADRVLEAAPHASVKYLNVSAPFHSPLMQSAADKLALELRNVETGPGRWPIISNVTARPYGREELVELLYRQMTHPVRWRETMEYLHRNGMDRAVEVGPRQVLTQLMKETYPAVQTFHVEHPQEMNTLRPLFAADETRRDSAIAAAQAALTAALIARNRNEDAEAYTTGVVEPIRQTRELIEQMRRRDGNLDVIQILDRIRELLQQILNTKQLPPDKQNDIVGKLQAIGQPAVVLH
ncbi:ACP S-malonyltransferase [Paenibacillus sp. alder61]|uniref:ACP S-malonyltransferase n=1 Tax=Paenibacillus sp. alder61 TaxID=2862948 RepID=UPI001CD5103F|nr:ACP S-malonyltransferase [Paenibacillus sp. alder61]MCA1293864.1 ACP S-malonyltransferase [Paenibacillus sp. alder61]